jgi:D-3-phosphoglycerate dehydrogenase / 2-oxoglutarate reductase
MSDKPIVVISPEAFWQKPGPFVDLLETAGYEVRYPSFATFTRGPSEEETVRELAGAVGVVAGGEYFTASVLDQLPDLKVIARCGVGYDRVDVAAATQRGVALTITPTANHEGVAEHAFALILAVAKDIAKNDSALRNGHWSQLLTKPVRGETLGLIGLGRIGRSTALLGKSLGMKVIAYEMYPDQAFVKQHGIELLELDEVLGRSDFVSLHCPLNEQTHGLCDAEFFGKMKTGSTLINTARGGLVVEDDLVAALDSGQLGAAGLDVYLAEPPPTDHPLFQYDQVVLSPHVAGTDRKSMVAMLCEAGDCIVKLMNNEWPGPAVVNQELRETWSAEAVRS